MNTRRPDSARALHRSRVFALVIAPTWAQHFERSDRFWLNCFVSP